MKKALFLFTLIFSVSCKSDVVSYTAPITPQKNVAAISLMGKDLIAPEPSQKLVEKYENHKSKYLQDTSSVENLIWYARFEAYLANYNEAIELFNNGIKRFPNDPRLYRHVGHRYISVRDFDAAIDNLNKAVSLIEGKDNEVEPDGMPNAQNIPVSTLHGNIWYHLGLAYYLKNDMQNALASYKNCLASGSNPDNIVSSTHWLYMISRRMDNKDEADRYLTVITKDMEVIENMAYHNICLFYKGEISLKELIGDESQGASNDAISYAVANWHLYNNDLLAAKPLYDKLLAKASWNSFGYIAAEADFVREF